MSNQQPPHTEVDAPILIIGAGPAGLTAGYQLAKAKRPVIILESDSAYVGGISKTVTYKGCGFDIGGHRFFSKSDEVENLWTEMLPNDLLARPRSSRILYRKRFYEYPLNAKQTFCNLGIINTTLCMFSYMFAKMRPHKNPQSFTDWVKNQFGARLYNIFFKTYTEKVWGMPCEAISADWAAQRIQGLSLFSVIKNALLSKKNKHQANIKSLIKTFRYPRKGPGMLWEACANRIKAMQGNIILGATVIKCEFDKKYQHWLVTYQDAMDQQQQIIVAQIISTAPLRTLITDLLAVKQPDVLKAAQALQYRDFLIVALILKERNTLKDNWIYVHDKYVDVARIQNFKSWSPELVSDPSLCCYGMEYFCFKDDTLWSLPDEALKEKAMNEIVSLGLAEMEDLIDAHVVRQPKAYPVYDHAYQNNVGMIREYLIKNHPTLHTIGRNGMHKYNNQDHSMMTAMLTVKNILAEKLIYDIWCVNQDAEYHEQNNLNYQHLLNSGLQPTPFN